jgi:uncharacterized protein (UPF0261 family)
VKEPIVLLIGTLDTKGREIAYLRNRMLDLGLAPVVMDSGILGEPDGIEPDISRAEVAEAARSDIETIRRTGSRGAAVERMCDGIRRIALKLHGEGKLAGVACLGGAEGAVLGAAAMKVLPIGLPKVLATPIASGKRTFGPFVGTRDVMIVHSVVDILGLNPISRPVFDNVASAMKGMLEHSPSKLSDKDSFVGITMLGNTTSAVMQIREVLSGQGLDTVIFHSNGVGGPAMEEMASAGAFVGVIDFTTDELADELIGGFHATDHTRLTRVGELGLPQIVVPGCIDFTVQGRESELPDHLRDRPSYKHNPEFTLVRTIAAEMARLGEIFAQRLNGATGPVEVIVPTGGLSIPNTPEGPFWDPRADDAFVQSLKSHIRSDIPVVTRGQHINDPGFAKFIAERFMGLLGATSSREKEREDIAP